MLVGKASSELGRKDSLTAVTALGIRELVGTDEGGGLGSKMTSSSS